jgi:hypothetical protein
VIKRTHSYPAVVLRAERQRQDANAYSRSPLPRDQRQVLALFSAGLALPTDSVIPPTLLRLDVGQSACEKATLFSVLDRLFDATLSNIPSIELDKYDCQQLYCSQFMIY